MNTSKLNKVAILTSMICFSGVTLANGLPANSSFSGSGQDKLIVKGALKKTNSCDVNINKGGIFDMGVMEIKDKLSPAGGVFASKKFRATIKCDYPSAVVLSWASSRPATVTYEKNFSKTFSPAGNKVYNTQVVLEQGNNVSSPTQLGLLNIGTKQGYASAAAVASSVSTLDSHTGSNETYLSSNPAFRKMIAFREGVNFSMNKTYSLPFKVQLKSRPYGEWINDMPSGKLKLNEQITIKSYII